MWFIFAPATKEQTDAGEGLNDNIPQATTEKLTENKLKAYELVDHTTQEEQAREAVSYTHLSFQSSLLLPSGRSPTISSTSSSTRLSPSPASDCNGWTVGASFNWEEEIPVSYTHLDVYKRQVYLVCINGCTLLLLWQIVFKGYADLCQLLSLIHI